MVSLCSPEQSKRFRFLELVRIDSPGADLRAAGAWPDRLKVSEQAMQAWLVFNRGSVTTGWLDVEPFRAGF